MKISPGDDPDAIKCTAGFFTFKYSRGAACLSAYVNSFTNIRKMATIDSTVG